MMRKIVFLSTPVDQIRRIILHETASGVYLYLSPTMEDGEVSYDQWHLDLDEALWVAEKQFGINVEDWTKLPKPSEESAAHKLGDIPIRTRVLSDRYDEFIVFELKLKGHWINATA